MQQDLSRLTLKQLLALAESYGTPTDPPSFEIQNASLEELFAMVEDLANEPVQG